MSASTPRLHTLVGQKILVAFTGLFMFIFVLMHLAGNLQVYSGPNALNEYAAFLKSIPKLVWSFRIFLIISIVIHIWLTISLTAKNNNARPQKYFIKTNKKASIFSRTMMWSGLTVLLFICYHLAHYTLGFTNPEFMLLTDEYGRHHVYNMVVMGFQNPLVSSFYIVAQALLAGHLTHGISSAPRTLGISIAYHEKIRFIGMVICVLIALLYISIPCAVLLGLLPLDY
jgi:succinate dehydrogenase / fumarate reductase cytochrome b subunit